MFGGLFVCIVATESFWRSRKDKVLRYLYRLNTSLALHFGVQFLWSCLQVLVSASAPSLWRTCTPFQGPVVTSEEIASYSISSSSQALVRPHSLPSSWKVMSCCYPFSALLQGIVLWSCTCYVLSFSSFLPSFGLESTVLRYCTCYVSFTSLFFVGLKNILSTVQLRFFHCATYFQVPFAHRATGTYLFSFLSCLRYGTLLLSSLLLYVPRPGPRRATHF